MKITDYGILFMCILLCFLSVAKVKDNMLFKYLQYTEEINNISDQSITYSLENSYEKSECVVENIDREFIIDNYVKNMSILKFGRRDSKYEKSVRENIVLCILCRGDSYELYRDGIWSEKIIYRSELHEQRVMQIEKEIEDFFDEQSYNRKILLPKNDGENGSQTVSENSVLLLFECNEYRLDGNWYSECILSGAAIKRT